MLALDSMLLLVIGTGLGASLGPAGLQVAWLVAVVVGCVMRTVRRRRAADSG